MRHGGVGIAEVDDVDHVLAELRQLFGRIDGPWRQDRLERLVGIADPLLADRLIGIVRDRQRVVEVDLLVALGQRGSRQAGLRGGRDAVGGKKAEVRD